MKLCFTPFYWTLIFCSIAGSFFIKAETPQATDDVVSTGVNMPVLIDVVSNDWDSDGEPLVVTVSSANEPNCGGASLINNGDGSLIFIPGPTFTGQCRFKYFLTAGSDTVAAWITVNILDNLTTGQLLITNHPTPSITPVNGTATFEVTAAGQNIDFQWQKDGVDITDSPSDQYTVTHESNRSILSIQNIGLADIGDYRCIATSDDVATSKTAMTAISEIAPLLIDGSGQTQMSFAGITVNMPGVLEAEAFDQGDPGLSHFDQTADNQGERYRNGNADISRTGDGRYVVTNIEDGEWLEYSMQNASTANFDLLLTVAADKGDANTGIAFSADLNGQSLFCERQFPATGGAEQWQTVLIPNIQVTAGSHIFRLKTHSAGWHIDSLEWVPALAEQRSYAANGLPHPIAQPIQSEAYDLGGSNLAYMDTTTANSGNYCGREPDSVDLSQEGARIYVTDIVAGEWLEYTVDIPFDGTFDLDLEYRNTSAAAEQNGSLRFEVNEDGISQTVTLPASTTWRTQTISLPALTSGNKVVRLRFTNPTFELDSFSLSPPPGPPMRLTHTVSGDPVDLGSTQYVGATVTDQPLNHEFTIHNDSPHETLILDDITISAGAWTLTGIFPSSVPPLGSANFKLKLLSSTAINPASALVSIESSGSNSDGFSFTIQGAVEDLELVVHTANDGVQFFSINSGTTIYLEQDGTPHTMAVTASNDAAVDVYLALSDNHYFGVGNSPVRIPEGSRDYHRFWPRFEFGNATERCDPYTATLSLSVFGNDFASFPLHVDNLVGGRVNVISHPQDQHVVTGGTAELQVSVSGGSGSYVYEWKKRVGFDWETLSGSNYQGLGTANLRILNVDSQAVYHCFITDANCGRNALATGNATVFVHPQVVADNAPANLISSAGQLVSFGPIQASGGNGAYAYTWQFRPLGGSWQDIDPANGAFHDVLPTQSTLELPVTRDTQIGEYRCKISQTNAPGNIAFSQPAYLSFLKITKQPADLVSTGFGYFNVEATAGGLPITYQWFEDNFAIGDGGYYQGTQTPNLQVDLADFHYSRNYACWITDGLATIMSANGDRRNIFGPSNVAVDTFNRGNLLPETLNGVSFPYGDYQWQADAGIQHQSGDAMHPAGAITTSQAQISFVPLPESSLSLDVEASFKQGLNTTNWIDVGFYNHDDQQILMRLLPNNQVQLIADNQVIATATSPNNDYDLRLSYNSLNRQVSLGDLYGTVISASLPAAFTPTINRAGFVFNRGSATASSGSGDLRLSEFWLREEKPFQPVDDVAMLDISQSSSISLEVLENDHGVSLTMGDLLPNIDTAGTPVLLTNQTADIGYTAPANFTGWDRFYYETYEPHSLEAGVAEVSIFVHNGPVLHAENDSLELESGQSAQLNVISNDFHTSGEVVTLNNTGFPIQVGSVYAEWIDDGTINLTVNGDDMGTFQIPYTIQSQSGSSTTGTVKVTVTAPYQGLIADDFDPTPTYRGTWIPTENKITQFGNRFWRESHPDPAERGLFIFHASKLLWVINQNTDPTATATLWQPIPNKLDSLAGIQVSEDFNGSAVGPDWSDMYDPSGKISWAINNPINGSASIKVSLAETSTNINDPSNERAFVRKQLPHPVNSGAVQFMFSPRQFQATSNVHMNMLNAGGPNGGGLNLHFRQNPTPSVRFIWVDTDGKWRSSGWVNIDPSLPAQKLKVAWQTGTFENPTGYVKLWLNDQLAGEKYNIENLGQTIQTVSLGLAWFDPNGLQGNMVYDDFQLFAEDDVVLEGKIRFKEDTTTTSKDETFVLGYAQIDNLPFDDPRQTALYVRAIPGGIELHQRNQRASTLTGRIAWAAYNWTAGSHTKISMQYHRGNRTVSVYVDDNRVIDSAPLDGALDFNHLNIAGLYIEAPQKQYQHVHRFSLRSAGQNSLAQDDRYELPLNEVLTLDVRENDYEPGGVVPTIETQPSNGTLTVNSDGTFTYRPTAVGTDQFTYRLTRDSVFTTATVHLTVEPAVSSDISLMKIHQDDFETGDFQHWTIVGNAGRNKPWRRPPMVDSTHYGSYMPGAGSDTSPAYLEHIETSGHSYVRTKFLLKHEIEQDTSALLKALTVGDAFDLEFRALPQPQVRLIAKDHGGYVKPGFFDLDPAIVHHQFEIEWWSSHSAHVGGGMRLWLNGELLWEQYGMNFGNLTVDTFRFGIVSGIDNLYKGWLHFDNIHIWRSE